MSKRSIVKLIKASNRNANINIVLTRDNDVTMSPPERVDYANKIGADLLVSVHCNSADRIRKNGAFIENPARGYEVVLPSNDRVGMENCKLLASSINTVLDGHNFSVGKVTQKKIGIWILKATNCPATLIECGYISNAEDLKQLKTKAYQQEMATNILTGIETYLVNKESDRKAVVVDTVPSKKTFVTDLNGTLHATADMDMKDATKFKKGDSFSLKTITAKEVPNYKIILYNSKVISQNEFDTMYLRIGESVDISVVKASSIINKFGESAKNGVVVIRSKTKDPLYIVDGKVINQFDINSLNPARVKSMNFLKDKNATDKYGDEGMYGVIEIFLKKDVNDTMKLFNIISIAFEINRLELKTLKALDLLTFA